MNNAPEESLIAVCEYHQVTTQPQVFPLSEGYKNGVILFLQNQTLKAFDNLCPHAFARLDFANTPITAFDGYHILCNVHGAQFDPNSGVCTIGPCVGDRLTPVTTRVIDNQVYVLNPS